MSRLIDSEFEALKERLNDAIHEIVFAIKHADDDELEDACVRLVTAAMTIEAVNEELVALENAS